MALELLGSLLKEVMNVSSDLISDTAISVGNYSGAVTGQFASGVTCASLHLQSGTATGCSEVKELLHMKTMREEGWNGLASEGNARFELLDIVAPASQDTAEDFTNLRLDRMFTKSH